MSISYGDLKYLLETVLNCEVESGKDHIRYVLKVNDKIIARTKFSHSSRKSEQISDHLLHLQAQQMHCPMSMWKLLLQRRLGKEDYFRELLKGKIITQTELEILLKK